MKYMNCALYSTKLSTSFQDLVKEEKNFYIENFYSYLESNYVKTTISKIQYIKDWQNLSLSIKLTLPQENINDTNNPNYWLDSLRIKANSVYKFLMLEIPLDEEGANIFRAFYYVNSIDWISKNTAQFNLSLDVINTFVQHDGKYIYGLSKRTHITREHKDRFVEEGIDSYPIIDKINEGFNPQLYSSSTHEVRQDMDLDFYLVYRNRNNPTPDDLDNPIDCFVCASERFDVKYENTSPTLTINANSLEAGKMYYCSCATLNQLDSATINVSADGYTYVVNTNGSLFIMFYLNSNNKITIKQLNAGFSSDVREVNQITFPSSLTAVIAGVSIDSTLTTAIQIDALPRDTLLTSVAYVNNSIYDIDRTDSKIIKIIKLPYCPFKVVIDEDDGAIVLDNTKWQYTSRDSMNMIRALDLSIKFDYDFEDDLNVYSPLLPRQITPTFTENRNNAYEMKLYNSEFHLIKYFYDSFNCSINLEEIERDENFSPTTNKIRYVVSTTINSRFMFIFKRANEHALSPVDFPNILTIARNNDITLFNQQYINYIRSGYNYDVKTRSRQESSSWLGTGLSLVGGVAGILGAGATGGISATAGIGLITSAVANIHSSITNEINNEQALSRNLEVMKNQAVQVSGSDDVDLMSIYSKNRLLCRIYEPSTKIKNMIADFFYYYGYKTNYFARPTIKTRYWFNFIQCEPDYEDEVSVSMGVYYGYLISALPARTLRALTDKFKEGITFFWNNSGVWNIEQTKENWERIYA